MRALFFLLLLASMPVLPAQNTWIVECTGRPGTHFRDLPPAVAAASPGDTIVLIAVNTPCTALYTATVIDKPLRVVGVAEFGAPGTATGAGLNDRLTVRNIPANGEVLLANLSIRPRSPGTTPHGLVVENCAGKVHLERVGNLGLNANGELRFQDCADVSIHWCTFWTPDQPVTFRRSNATISEVTFNDSYPAVWLPPPWGISTTVDNILVDGGTVRMTDCVVWGASETTIPTFGTFPARRAATIHSGSLMLGPGARLYGGSTSSGYSPAIDNHDLVVRDPRSNNTGILRDPMRDHAAAEEIRSLHSVWMEPPILNQQYRVSVGGPPGGFAFLAVGSSMPQGIAFPFGTLLLNPNDLMVIGSGPLEQPWGYRTWQFATPGNLPLDHLFAFQAAYIAAGQLGLTYPAVFSVTWEGGRSWP